MFCGPHADADADLPVGGATATRVAVSVAAVRHATGAGEEVAGHLDDALVVSGPEVPTGEAQAAPRVLTVRRGKDGVVGRIGAAAGLGEPEEGRVRTIGDRCRCPQQVVEGLGVLRHGYAVLHAEQQPVERHLGQPRPAEQERRQGGPDRTRQRQPAQPAQALDKLPAPGGRQVTDATEQQCEHRERRRHVVNALVDATETSGPACRNTPLRTRGPPRCRRR